MTQSNPGNTGEMANEAIISESLNNPDFLSAFTNLINANNDASKPQAYVNYLFFDERFNFVEKESGMMQVTSPNAWEELWTGAQPKQIREAGYMFVFHSMASMSKIYFDDFDFTYYKGDLLDETHYYPFGLTIDALSNQALGTEQKYKYNGIELNRDFNIETYDAFYRGLDPQIGRWNQIDPKSEMYVNKTPYNSMGNNPISITDYLGDTESPIFNEDTGELLGTDDQGLTGPGISMPKANFKQNMTHEEALKNGNLLSAGKMNGEALTVANATFNSLPSRPDYDGKMSYSEILNWGRLHPGSPVFIDAAKLDFGNVSLEDFKKGIGIPQQINLVGKGTPLDTYGPWGKNEMTIKSIDKKNGSAIITMRNDGFDYTPHNRDRAYRESTATGLYEDIIRNPANAILRTIHNVDVNFHVPLRPYGYKVIPATIPHGYEPNLDK